MDSATGGYWEKDIDIDDYISEIGPVTLRLGAGEGYTLGDPSSVCVTIESAHDRTTYECDDIVAPAFDRALVDIAGDRIYIHFNENLTSVDWPAPSPSPPMARTSRSGLPP